MAQAKFEEPQWPPRTPFEALLSSPSGRKRLHELRGRDSISPSPTKRSRPTRDNTNGAHRRLQVDGASSDDNEVEEDEETLQLKLEAIEAKLKLKKLRQAKAKDAAIGSHVGRDNSTNRSRPATSAGKESALKPAVNSSGWRENTLRKSKSQQHIQVPLSPPVRRMAVQEQTSPGRVLLGIDKGLKGRDVSLRRAPGLRNGSSPRSGQSATFGGQSNQHASHLRRHGDNPSQSAAKPKSFSERIAESRAADQIRRDKEQRIRQSRSKGFGVPEKELEREKNACAERCESVDPFMAEAMRTAPREYTRDEVLQSYNQPDRRFLQRSKTAPDLIPGAQKGRGGNTSSTATPSDSRPATASNTSYTSKSTFQHPSNSSKNDASRPPTDPSKIEPFSGIHLSTRTLSHRFLTKTLSGKKTFTIPELLRIIKSPSYDAPDIEEDFVVLGIITSKSAPRSHKDDPKTANPHGQKSDNGRGKYMVLQLTDLKWELDLFLFGTAFDRYWKLTPGTVLAILNPGIMPPPPSKRDKGRFSLTLNSSDETVLEIGTARDLGFCKSVKRDAKVCSQWVDKRHTEYCEYHVDASLRKIRAGRMEVNTMTAPFGPGGRSGAGGRRGGFGGGGGGGGGGRFGRAGANEARKKDDGLRREGPFYDRATHSDVYVTAPVPGFGRSSASLLDDEDVDPDAFHRGYSKQERMRRQLASQEREREIARKLSEGAGGGMGREYLRAATAAADTTGQAGPNNARDLASTAKAAAPTNPDPPSRNLINPTPASSIRLSPIKRKHAATLSSSATTPNLSSISASKAMGWSRAFKTGLPSPPRPTAKRIKDVQRLPSSGTDDTASLDTATTGGTDGGGGGGGGAERARKKTRFVTAKGIREAGRESLGGAAAASAAALGSEDGVVGGDFISSGVRGPNGADDEDDDDGLDIV